MDDITHIQDIMCHAWAESTHKTYGSGLLVFHVYCDSCSIPEEDRTPASSTLISTFIAVIAGSYSGKTITKYIFGSLLDPPHQDNQRRRRCVLCLSKRTVRPQPHIPRTSSYKQPSPWRSPICLSVQGRPSSLNQAKVYWTLNASSQSSRHGSFTRAQNSHRLDSQISTLQHPFRSHQNQRSLGK
jgi:hypothetical protein